MKQLIELGAVRIGAAIQNVCANVDFDVLSLPGGSLVAVVLWLYASAAGSVRRATRWAHRSSPPCEHGSMMSGAEVRGQVLKSYGAWDEIIGSGIP